MQKAGGLRYITELDGDALTAFRATWPNHNLSALKKLELLRTFFRFCEDRSWVGDNPARKIKNPNVAERPTMPFTHDEQMQILKAIEPLRLTWSESTETAGTGSSAALQRPADQRRGYAPTGSRGRRQAVPVHEQGGHARLLPPCLILLPGHWTPRSSRTNGTSSGRDNRNRRP